MGRAPRIAVVFLAAVACISIGAPQSSQPAPAGRDPASPPIDDVIAALLQRDRSLAAVHFEIPLGLYERYLTDTFARRPPPVTFLPDRATYTLQVPKRGRVTLTAKLELQVLDAACPAIGVLTDKRMWDDVTINGAPAHLPAVDGFLRFLPPRTGPYVITATTDLRRSAARGTTTDLDVLPATQTVVVVDSPGAWQVTTEPAGAPLTGTPAAGTHGRIALPPLAAQLKITCQPPPPQTDRPPRFELDGQVAWNIDSGSQQVAAVLDVTIAGGPSDRFELLLPPAADRLQITGPDVAQVTATPGRATVSLHGKLLGRTRLNLAFELPARDAATLAFGPLAVADGHWTGGTLAITNSAGSSEVVPAAATGLEEIDLADLPPAARALLAAPAVLAYRIAARQFDASVEVLSLGEFALRQSIADLAHYQVFCAADGAMLGKVRYDIRNRAGQFLTLTLPPGAQPLLARVNDQPCPLSPAAAPGAWLLPLERSRASVMGLVSFPVEVVYLAHLPPLAAAKVCEIPLPQIDLPIAYGWCQAYLPRGLVAKAWTGPMKRADRLSSEIAQASLDYGRAELAAPAALEGPAAQAVLARNYYLAGNAAYDHGDFAVAEEQLRQVIQLAPGSTEAANAQRLIANRQMLRGQFTARTTEEKSSALQVQREVAESNRPISQQQESAISEAVQAARTGKPQEAAAKLKVAEQLGQKLIERGTSKKELAARSRLLQQQGQEVKSQLESSRFAFRDQMTRSAQAGDYEHALQLGMALKDLDADSPQLRAEMESLALAANRQQQIEQRQRPPVPAAPATAAPPTTALAPQPPADAGTSAFDVRDLLAAAPSSQPQPQQTPDDRIVALVKQNVDPDYWRDPSAALSVTEGVLVVKASPAQRQAVADLLTLLRQARGPAVEVSGRIAAQRAIGLPADASASSFDAGVGGGPSSGPEPSRAGGSAGSPAADNEQLRRFITANYDWQQRDGGGPGPALDKSTLINRLQANLGQKITVTSFNLALDPATAAALGVRFETGRNNLSYALLDDPQFRSLLQLAEARAAGSARSPLSGRRSQETIVGTDALLANGMTANAAFAGEDRNTLDVAGNGISLPHDRYLAVVSDGRLTVVRAGAFQFWTERSQDLPVVAAPQSIEVPRVGQLVQFEKTLLDPADRLVLRADTTWKGIAP